MHLLSRVLTPLTALSFASLLFAQVAPTASGPTKSDEAVKLDTFVVTGSNVKRFDLEKVLPVTVFDLSAMEVRDASQPSDLLTALPQVTGLPGNETAFGTTSARGDNASISLRGIPSSNTLILIDGRRLAPHPISQAETGTPTLSVNVNQLPNRGVDRIEILRDGASSIYGTDAVAGVVNYHMQTHFRGTELALRYGETRYGDGGESRATLTHGFDFAQGKGHVMFTADYYDRKPMYIRERPFAAEADLVRRAPAPWNVYTDTTFNFRSTSSEYGSFVLGTVTATDPNYGNVTGFTGARPTGVPSTMASSSGTFFITPLASGGVGFSPSAPTRAATGPGHDYYWNNNTYRVMQPKSTRTNVFLTGEYDLNDRITAFTELSLYQANSTTYREPDAYGQSTDGFMIVPATNPYNPFGTHFWSPSGAPNADGSPRLTGTPSAVSITNKRFTDLATRTDYVTDSVYRGVAGLRGKLAGSWSWEAALLWSAARGIEYEAGSTRRSLLAAALNQTDPAKAFNPFTRTFAVQNGTLVVTGNYQNPTSLTSTFQQPFIRNGITKLGSGDFRASGDVLGIWGGNSIGGAFGGEFRYEAFDDFRPPYAGLNPSDSGLDPTLGDFVTASPNADTHGNRHVLAAYAETVIPVVGGRFTLPLVRSLELSASGRYERYTDFGSTTKPKVGVNWKPTSWVMVRASYNEGFHAPNLAQLFTGVRNSTLLSSNDTYRSVVTQLPTDSSSNRRQVAAGNPNLRPETSKGKSAGIVVEVPRIKGMSVSVDYWEIAQKDVISSGGGIAQDSAALQAATQAALAAGQNINAIDLGSGTANYLGDPSVVRLPVTQADKDFFAAYNATRAPGNQRAVVGAIDYIRATYFNKASQFVNGFDFNLHYRVPRLAIGDFTFDTSWTLLNDFHAYTSPSAARTDYRDSNSANSGGASSKWRGSSSLSWHRKQWGAGIGFYYVGRYTDSGATTSKTTYDALGDPSYIQPFFSNGSFTYRYVVHDSKSYNVFLSYRFATRNRWLSQTDLRLGVNNVFDAKPPLASASIGYDASVYNTLARGRTYAVQLTKKF